MRIVTFVKLGGEWHDISIIGRMAVEDACGLTVRIYHLDGRPLGDYGHAEVARLLATLSPHEASSLKRRWRADPKAARMLYRVLRE